MTFELDLRKFAEKTGLRMNLVLRKTALDAYSGVIKRSPVKEGRFRGNHRLGVNRIDLTTSKQAPARSRGTKVGDPARAAETVSARNRALSIEVGDRIFITNNLVYGPPLEGGSSEQARTGIYQPTLTELVASFQSIVDDAKGQTGGS